MLNTVTFYSPSAFNLFSLQGLDVNFLNVPIANLTLLSGTNIGNLTNLQNPSNLDAVTFTPVGGIVKLTFECDSSLANLNVKYDNYYKITKLDISNTNITLDGTLPNSLVNNIASYFIAEYSIQANTVEEITGLTRINYYTTGMYISGTTSVNGSLKYKFVDSLGTYFDNYKNISANNFIESNSYTIYPNDISSLMSLSFFKLKEQSNLANLYEQQAAGVLSINIAPFDDNYDKVTVVTDKNCQCVIYGISQTSLGVESSVKYFSRDTQALGKIHTYLIEKSSGYNRVVAIPTLYSFYRDFNYTTPNSSLQSYSYSTEISVVSKYQEGYDAGYIKAYQEVYSLGTAYGYNFDFDTRSDYGTLLERTKFVNTIADNQYLKAYREVYDRGAAYGYTYNTASTVRSYYIGEQTAFINKMTSAGKVEAYKDTYTLGTPYGFSFDNTQTDGTYYEGIKNSFVSTIDSYSDARGYKRGYSELFAAGRSYETLMGVPEGTNAWVNDVDTNPTFYNKKDEFIRHVYNSAYVRAKQETFDRGIPYSYDFRNFITTGTKLISDSTLLTDYLNQGANFIDTVTANAQATGYKDVYNYVNTTFGFSYNSTNSTGLTLPNYVTYLSGLKASMTAKVGNDSKVLAYKEIYDIAATDFLFSYSNTSTNATFYSGLKTDMLKQVYNYGARAAFQELYDRGLNYHFFDTSGYLTYKNASYLMKPLYDDATTTAFKGMEEKFELRIFEGGVVLTYKRFYDLALIYGFVYDTNQFVASYYDSRREEFLDIYRSGNYSEGMKFVFDTANLRYSFNYNYSVNVEAMKTQVVPMFDFIDNKVKTEAYKYTLDSLSNESFYNTTYDSTTLNADSLKNQILPNLTKMKRAAGAEAYKYVFSTANTRDSYNAPLSNDVDILKTNVPLMFKYVEDYKEADGYRRVHNYAKNFLNIGYTFEDSQDPHVLEDQVPPLFEYLIQNGGVGAYKYVLDMAHERDPLYNYNYYNGISTPEIKANIPEMFTQLENDWKKSSFVKVYNYFSFPYTDGTAVDLESQIGDLFDFIIDSSKDIDNVVGPIPMSGGRVKFVVTLRRSTSLIGLLTDKTTGNAVDFKNEQESKLIHEIILKYPGARGQRFNVMFVPGANTYAV